MLFTQDAFFEIIQDTWKSTLEFEVDRAGTEAYAEAGAFTVCVKASGAWTGEVYLHCSPSLARLIAAAIFQVNAEEAGNDEILDSLCELIHIVGGNLKALLPQPIALSLPSPFDPTNLTNSASRWQMACRLNLTSKGYPFSVTLLGDLPSDEREQFLLDPEHVMPAENA